jgi:hypothetical protein
MQQIVLELHRMAEDLLGSRTIWSLVLPESDEETFAAHRIVMTIECGVGEDMESFAASAFRLHKHLTSLVSREEYLAIRLVIEPKLQPSRESVG